MTTDCHHMSCRLPRCDKQEVQFCIKSDQENCAGVHGSNLTFLRKQFVRSCCHLKGNVVRLLGLQVERRKPKWNKATTTWRVMISNAQVKGHICIRFNVKGNKFDRIFCFLFVGCWFSYPANDRACECVAANGIRLSIKQHVNSHGCCCSRGMDSLTAGSVQTVWLQFALGFLKAGLFIYRNSSTFWRNIQ